MRAMVVDRPGQPLRLAELPRGAPGPGQLLVRIAACGVCRTDLHVVDGDLPLRRSPIVPGHEIVGRVEAVGTGVEGVAAGSRIGVPWLGWTCGRCRYCASGRENLCDDARFTGYDLDGGYAEYAVADARYCFALPEPYSDAEAAPLLCAGLIGYRALAAAGDAAAQAFASKLGARWAGDSTAAPPEPLDAAILFAPVGALVPAALRATAKGGTVAVSYTHLTLPTTERV